MHAPMNGVPRGLDSRGRQARACRLDRPPRCDSTLRRHNIAVADRAAPFGRLRASRRVDRQTPEMDCDESGPPRWDAQRVTEERARGGPFSCCTLDWI